MASTVAAPTGVTVGRPRGKYTRVAVLGFLLLAASMVLWIAAALIAGQSLGDEIAFLSIPIVAGLVGAGVVWRFGTAGKAVGIVVALVPLVMMFWVAFSLFAPGAFAEFSGAAMFVVGGLSALGFSIAGIVRRGDMAVEATAGEVRAMRIIIGIVALAVVVSAVATFIGRSTVDAAASEGAIPATLSNFAFSPSTFEATAGEPTKFVVHNSDAFVHDFAIDALGINAGTINPGSSKLVEFTAPEPGEYIVRCTLHSGDGDTIEEGEMKARLTVR